VVQVRAFELAMIDIREGLTLDSNNDSLGALEIRCLQPQHQASQKRQAQEGDEAEAEAGAWSSILTHAQQLKALTDAIHRAGETPCAGGGVAGSADERRGQLGHELGRADSGAAGEREEQRKREEQRERGAAREEEWQQGQQRRVGLRGMTKELEDKMQRMLQDPPERSLSRFVAYSNARVRQRQRVSAFEEADRKQKSLPRDDSTHTLFHLLPSPRKAELSQLCANSQFMRPLESQHNRLLASFAGEARPSPSLLLFRGSCIARSLTQPPASALAKPLHLAGHPAGGGRTVHEHDPNTPPPPPPAGGERHAGTGGGGDEGGARFLGDKRRGDGMDDHGSNLNYSWNVERGKAVNAAPSLSADSIHALQVSLSAHRHTLSRSTLCRFSLSPSLLLFHKRGS
jgi:hypothetical protein